MADTFSDRLAGYVEVKDRIAVLLEFFPQARIVTTYELTREPDDKPKVICRALVYRTPDDPVPTPGTSWMYLPGTTSFTKGSEIENAETSAVGRAIGLVGILIDKSIATTNEIEAKSGERPEQTREPVRSNGAVPEPEPLGEYSGTGKLMVRKPPSPADGFLRQDPDDGSHFVVAFGEAPAAAGDAQRVIPQVVFRGKLAADTYDAASGSLDGLVCTLEGELFRVYHKKDGKVLNFQRLEARRISTPSWSLPAPAVAAVPEPDSGQAHAGVPPDEEAELDALALNL